VKVKVESKLTASGVWIQVFSFCLYCTCW